MGTSLTVLPFCAMIHRVGNDVPRLYINREYNDGSTEPVSLLQSVNDYHSFVVHIFIQLFNTVRKLIIVNNSITPRSKLMLIDATIFKVSELKHS